jgi:hypothetical protein
MIFILLSTPTRAFIPKYCCLPFLGNIVWKEVNKFSSLNEENGRRCGRRTLTKGADQSASG